jgi:predicted amidophosphoribosyltransferase
MPTALSEVFALLAPPLCVACRAAVPRAEVLVCATCLRALPWLRGRLCPRCGLPTHGARGCPAVRLAFTRAWAPLGYQGVARDLVAALKFGGALPLAGLMAAHIAANLPADLRRRGPPVRDEGSAAEERAPPAVVAVPAQPRRARRRGFDPAGALAAGLAARTALPRSAPLRRRDRAPRQVGLGRAQRRRGERIAVEAVAPAAARVLLVDDVHTTGTTLDVCARALLGAGAREVVAVTYARTL